nr:myoblast determination protein 1-like [Chlorocebus sabaeus]
MEAARLPPQPRPGPRSGDGTQDGLAGAERRATMRRSSAHRSRREGPAAPRTLSAERPRKAVPSPGEADGDPRSRLDRNLEPGPDPDPGPGPDPDPNGGPALPVWTDPTAYPSLDACVDRPHRLPIAGRLPCLKKN